MGQRLRAEGRFSLMYQGSTTSVPGSSPSAWTVLRGCSSTTQLSPVQFTDLEDGPLEFLACLVGTLPRRNPHDVAGWQAGRAAVEAALRCWAMCAPRWLACARVWLPDPVNSAGDFDVDESKDRLRAGHAALRR